MSRKRVGLVFDTLSSLKKGFSLVELLVVMGVFSIIAAIAVGGVLLSLRGSKKSESLAKVRENLNYAAGVMERQLRNAESVVCLSTQSATINFIGKDGAPSNFICDLKGNDFFETGFITTNGNRITSPDVDVEVCYFYCNEGDGKILPSVDIFLEGFSARITSDTAGSGVILSTKVYLRSY